MERERARRRILGLATLAALLAALPLLALRGDEPARVAGDRTPVESPDWTPATPEAPGRPALVGSVREASTLAPIRAAVFLRAPPGEAPRSVVADERGRFRIEAPAGAEGLLGAYASGFARQVRGLRTPEAGEVEVEFLLERGLALAGRIVDERGKGVEGLPILVVRGATPGSVISSYSVDERRLLESEDPESHAQRASTGAGGRFEVGGLAPGAYGVFSLDLDWFVLQEKSIPLGSAEVELRATRPIAIEGTTRDARTGAPIEGCAATAVTRARRAEGGDADFTAAAGRLPSAFFVAWRPVRRELETGFEVDLSIRKEGYVTWSARLVPAPGQRRFRVDAALEPVVPSRLVLEVRTPGGRAVDAPLRLSYARPDDPGAPAQDLLATPESPGRYVCGIPAGRWRLRLDGEASFLGLVSWTGLAEAPQPGDAPLRVTLPEHGTITLRFRASTSDERGFTIGRVGDAEDRALLGASGVDREHTLHGVPVGHWRIVGEDASGTHERVVHLADGQTAVVEFGP